jgi:hypothetical protein
MTTQFPANSAVSDLRAKLQKTGYTPEQIDSILQ